MKPPLLSEHVELLALHQRDAVVEWVCRADTLAMYLSALEARLRMGTRDGVRNVTELMGFVRDAPAVQVAINNFLVDLNVRDDRELKSLLDAGRQMKQIEESVATDLDLALSNAVDVAKSILILQPEKRSSVIAELGGVMPETNGGTA